MDQRIARSGVVQRYGRYVDDIVLMDPDIENLRAAYRMIVEELAALGLELHPDKTRCIPVADGFDFCGRYILPHRTYLRRRTAQRGWQAIEAQLKQMGWHKVVGTDKPTETPAPGYRWEYGADWSAEDGVVYGTWSQQQRPQPYPSWSWVDGQGWVPPVPQPGDDYNWDEATQSWIAEAID